MNQRTCVFLVACLSVGACWKHKDVATTPATPLIAIQHSDANVFATYDLKTAPGLSTTFSTHATSLSRTSLDTEVVERVVRARLKEATREALDDVLERAGASVSTKPARDIVESIASLVADASDGEARSQTLVAAVVRTGLAAWAAKVGGVMSGDGAACAKNADDMLNAAYEGLAASQYLRTLGFPESDGTFASDNCAKFGGQLSMVIDTLARFPDLSSTTFDSLKTDVATVIAARADDQVCGKAFKILPLDVKAAINAASSDDSKSLRALYEAAKTARAFATTAPSAERADVRACAELLVTFSDRFEDTLVRFSADATVKVDLEKIKQMIAEVEGIIKKIKSATNLGNAQLDSMRSILVRLVDGRALRRGDVVVLVKFIGEQIKPKIAALDIEVAREIALEVIDTLPEAIREDETAPAGIRMDVAALASKVLSEFSRQTRDGWYLRATVGTGYALYAGMGSLEERAAPSVYEEIGVGRRWQNGSVLHGPHVLASGILFNIVEDGADAQKVFLGAGYSLNLYHLVDISASVGRSFGLAGTSDDNALLIGLQVPLFDYLSALTSGGDVAQESTVGGK